MRESRWSIVKRILADALERDVTERSGFIAEACEGDESLRLEVEELVELEDEAATFLTASTPRSPVGRKIARYEIRREIAAGGMGIVYEAVQDHPHRVVALKLMRPGMASQQALRRFKHEAEILGRLRHPNIAQIFDAGTIDEGEGAQPYFAMEYIDGETLTAFADSRTLGVRERLELVLVLCEAVQYAHQRGVIHRDLKPDNILVDDLGRPRILDFGVARATDVDIQTTTVHTDVGQLIGTVPYMSPEQIGGDPMELDTRSDVYALGVVLYELLTGRLPHDVGGQPILEAARIVREEEHRPLSSIDRSFRGDLETITAKALEKDKGRRYQSASDLAADIRRYLNVEPIVARPSSALYQLRKFAKRNRALVGGVMMAFVLLVAGIFGTTRQWLIAREEAEKATRLAEFLVQSYQKRGVSWTLVSHLDRIERMLEQSDSFSDMPDVRADLHVTLGRSYLAQSRFDKRQEHFEKGLAIRVEAFGPDDVDTLDVRRLMAMGLSIADRERHNQEIVDKLRESHPGDFRTLLAERSLAESLFERGRIADSERLLRESLKAAAADPSMGRSWSWDEQTWYQRFTNQTMRLRARLLDETGRLDDAEEILRSVFDHSSADNRNVAIHLASLLGRTGQREEALDIAWQAYGAGPSEANEEIRATALNMTFALCDLLTEDDQGDESEKILRTQLETCRERLGDHPFTVWSMERLADTLGRRGDLDGAEEQLVDAIDLWSNIPEPQRTATDNLINGPSFHKRVLRTLATVREQQGDLVEAEALLRDVVEDAEANGTWFEHVSSLLAVATFLERQGAVAEAAEVRAERAELLATPDTAPSS